MSRRRDVGTGDVGTGDVGTGSLGAALRAYVQGHDRGWERRSKLGQPGQARDAGDSDVEAEFGRLPGAPRFGLPVPERLDYSRGPATQLDRSADKRGASHG